MGHMSEAALDLQRAIDMVEHAGLRILRPLVPGARILRPREDETPVLRGLMIDTETTGPDNRKDQIIQLGMVSFVADAVTGQLFEIGAPVTMLEEPTVPISPEATAVHGLTLDDVRGHRMEDARVFAAVQDADLLLAHNAKYDRPLFDRRFPGYLSLAPRPWACSYSDIPWRQARYSSAALGTLITEHCGMYFEGHDAGEDCAATVQCLATPFDHITLFLGAEQWPLWHIITRLQQPAKRIFAVGSPFECKDRLQARGYRWNDPTKPNATFPREPKAWYREVPGHELDIEMEWLTQQAYLGASAQLSAKVVDVPNTNRFAL